MAEYQKVKKAKAYKEELHNLIEQYMESKEDIVKNSGQLKFFKEYRLGKDKYQYGRNDYERNICMNGVESGNDCHSGDSGSEHDPLKKHFRTLVFNL